MRTITKEQFAELLNGNEYRDEITKEQESIAKENNFLVIFGASDDLLEVRGAINDEYGAYDSGEFLLVKKGEMYADDEDENTYHKAESDGLYDASNDSDNANHPRLIVAEWCPSDNPALSWRITSNIPAASFIVKEDDEPYCEGIVIDLDEVSNL